MSTCRSDENKNRSELTTFQFNNPYGKVLTRNSWDRFGLLSSLSTA